MEKKFFKAQLGNLYGALNVNHSLLINVKGAFEPERCCGTEALIRAAYDLCGFLGVQPAVETDVETFAESNLLRLFDVFERLCEDVDEDPELINDEAAKKTFWYVFHEMETMFIKEKFIRERRSHWQENIARLCIESKTLSHACIFLGENF